jgi:hypothetical protein
MWYASDRIVYKFLMGKPEGKIPLGRLRRRCVDNIKICLRMMTSGGKL